MSGNAQHYDSADEVSDASQQQSQSPPPQRRRPQRTMQRRPQRQQKQSGPLDSLPVGGQALDGVGDTVNNAVGGVTGALGGIAGGAVGQQGGGGGGKSDTLRLRLELNLDIEITLKARIHGDLELALLYVPYLLPFPFLVSPPSPSWYRRDAGLARPFGIFLPFV